MRRREFIAIARSAAAWPLAAGAQQATMPVVGFLSVVPPSNTPKWVDGFRQGLAETGYEEGRDVAVEYRWSDSDYDRLPDQVRFAVAALMHALGGLFDHFGRHVATEVDFDDDVISIEVVVAGPTAPGCRSWSDQPAPRTGRR